MKIWFATVASLFALVSIAPRIVTAAPSTYIAPSGAASNVVVAGSTGADGGYATLKAAFDALNANPTQTGNTITVTINGDTDETTNSAVLNPASGGAWNTLTISPVGARTVTGATTAGNPLIDLNGADNVTINGLNSLTISNTTASAAAGTSTIRLINGAQNNTITNCTVLGSSTSSAGTAGGNIFISTSVGGANSGNTISNNNLGPAGVNLPSKCVFSLGSASPNNNTGTIITNNNVFNFFTPNATCAGISIWTNSDTTTISNNRLYQTAARVFTTASLFYDPILVSLGNTGSATITGNTIGFGAPNATGNTLISGLDNRINGIVVPSASTTVATSIQGNTISGFDQTTSQGTQGGASGFIGISVGSTAGLFNIGGTTGNTIGSLDGSSGIVINNSTVTASSWGFVGIFDFSFQNLDVISNNNIGTITINNGGSGTGAGFRGIRLSGTTGQNVTISNNTIGGTTSGSITDNVVGDYDIYGIDNSSANATITGNTIRNITGNAQAAFSFGISGIAFTNVPTGANTVSQNTIHSLHDNAGAAPVSIYALFANFAATANVVERNFVHSLTINSTNQGSQLVGMLVVGGSGTYRNNMVRLGIDPTGADITGGYTIFGIFENAGTNSILANTSYIGGSNVVSSTSNTLAFVSNVTTGTRFYQDNIFWNARSNAGGGGKHYAISLAGNTGATSNFNDLFASGTGGFVGTFGGSDRTTLHDWKTATGLDANSVSVDPSLVAPNGTSATVNLHLTSDTSPVANIATPLAAVTNDFDNDPRSATTPDIGADEVTAAPSPTPTATATATATATPTASATSTPTATATATATATPTATATATPTATPPAQALNISTRMRVETGNNVLIGGFIITGNANKNIAVRGIGPSLLGFGISDALVDPTLELRGSNGSLILGNDNWQDDPAQAAQLSAVGLALQDSKESGIFAMLQPGAYTAILAGKNRGTGVGLVEIYDTNGPAAAELANISTRGFVLIGNNVMIGGFILGGNNNTRVAARGIGPSLAQFGLNPVLADPTLELHDSNGATLATNDNWLSDPISAAQLTANGLALSDPNEAGIFTSLPPGTFTVILAGKNGGTGIGLVEIYNLK
jgi:hypothetical protein